MANSGREQSLRPAASVGPVLYLHGVDAERLHLAALIAPPAGTPPPSVATQAGPVPVARTVLAGDRSVYLYHIALPLGGVQWYQVDGTRYTVNANFDDDLKLAYVSCNGQEEGDRERDPAERNALWHRLARQHQERPFQLLLHGGDQIYADEMLQTHPSVQRWTVGHRHHESDEDDSPEVASALRRHLFQRYLELYAQPEVAWLMARVPSLAMWDDHDICDGWGSLPDRKLDSAVGRTIFHAARQAFLLFQHGTTDEALPGIFLDEGGETLTWAVSLPGLRLVAPDLRSERRRHRVMGERGWQALDEALAEVRDEHVLLLSSVPALGPRLSWVERLMMLIPHMQKYEDDLRDQWQSRAHREEWRRLLRTVLAVHAESSPVTLLSGEIHLATRGTMAAAPEPVHQLVASGIAHPPPPRAYANVLGALASLGEGPLANHPIALHPLPGQRHIYTAQRNYLVLKRGEGRWTAHWELEHDGATPDLALPQTQSTADGGGD